MRPFICIHTPRKEWRNKLPTKINLIMANNRKDALAKFTPIHPNEPYSMHYNKPYAVDECQSPHYIG